MFTRSIDSILPLWYLAPMNIVRFFTFSVLLLSFDVKAMEYVELCKSKMDCKKFSRLVMGTDHLVQSNWTTEGQPELSEAEAFEILDEAAKNGINFFDTSPIYVGGVENKLGKWKKSRSAPIRENSFYYRTNFNPDRKLYILSKGGFPFDLFWSQRLEAGTHSQHLSRELRINGHIESTGNGEIALKNVPPGSYASRLYGSTEQITDRVAEELSHTRANLEEDITIYLMHRDDGDTYGFKAIKRVQTSVRTIMEALASPQIASYFWMLGWSNWQTDRITESLNLSHSEALVKPIINSPYFSLFEMSQRTIHALGVQVTHREMMDPSFQKGIKVMPYSPLGGFSILDKPAPQWKNAKKAAKEKFEQGDAYWQNVYHSLFTKDNEARWHRVVNFTRKFNGQNGTTYTIDQMINAYALAHPRTDFLAVGPVNKEQIRRTVGSLELAKKLTHQDLEYLYSGARN